MTNNEKNEIALLRKAGRSMNDIADELKLSRNTVKSFQDQHKLSADGIIGSDTWKALITE